MEKRQVSKMLSIFDLKDLIDFSPPQGASTRVMFLYDREENIKEFKLLDRKIPLEMEKKINSWLNKIDLHDLVCRLEPAPNEPELDTRRLM